MDEWARLTPLDVPGLRLFGIRQGRGFMLAEGNTPADLTSDIIRVSEDEALAFARQLDEVQALVATVVTETKRLDLLWNRLPQDARNTLEQAVQNLTREVAPFQEPADAT